MDNEIDTCFAQTSQFNFALIDTKPCQSSKVSIENDLKSLVTRIKSPFSLECRVNSKTSENHAKINLTPKETDIYLSIKCFTADLNERTKYIRSRMGSMAQCRGMKGDELRNAGAIDAVLNVLWRLMFTAPSKFIQTSPILSPAITGESEKGVYDFLNIVMRELDMAALDLAVVCMGSLRDLACGSALNRSSILEWKPPPSIGCGCEENYEWNKSLNSKNGIHIITSYVLRYHTLKWEEILSLRERGNEVSHSESDLNINEVQKLKDPKVSSMITERGKRELRLLTNALGAVRNTSHSTPNICQVFYESGLTGYLICRLIPTFYNSIEDKKLTVHNVSSRAMMTQLEDATSDLIALSESTQLWREARYRTAGSLINLAEKCPDVAYQLGSSKQIIYTLIELWGGAHALIVDTKKKSNSLPLLHNGLAAILHAADEGALESGLDELMTRILDREKIRKKVAQKREKDKTKRLIPICS